MLIYMVISYTNKDPFGHKRFLKRTFNMMIAPAKLHVSPSMKLIVKNFQHLRYHQSLAKLVSFKANRNP